MAATPYRATSWDDGLLSVEKLNQMSQNDHWLFENTPRMRYTSQTLVRDTGIKIIAGRMGYGHHGTDYGNIYIYFGSFFNASCKPVVNATIESGGRVDVTLNGLNEGTEIDYRGFRAHVFTQMPAGWATVPLGGPGWLNWIAVGF